MSSEDRIKNARGRLHEDHREREEDEDLGATLPSPCKARGRERRYRRARALPPPPSNQRGIVRFHKHGQASPAFQTLPNVCLCSTGGGSPPLISLSSDRGTGISRARNQCRHCRVVQECLVYPKKQSKGKNCEMHLRGGHGER